MKMGKICVSDLMLKRCKMSVFIETLQMQVLSKSKNHSMPYISNTCILSVHLPTNNVQFIPEFCWYSFIAMNLKFLTGARFPLWNVQTHLFLLSNDIMLNILGWKSIIQNDILLHFNVRLVFCIFSLLYKEYFYWKLDESQNLVCSWNPSLTSS